MAKSIKKIVAIGGGNINSSGTSAIDKEIIRLTKKKHPKLLFIPTASSDSENYYNNIDRYYGKKLGCKTDVLYLLKTTPSPKEIENIGKETVIWHNWLKYVRGIGPLIAGVIAADLMTRDFIDNNGRSGRRRVGCFTQQQYCVSEKTAKSHWVVTDR